MKTEEMIELILKRLDAFFENRQFMSSFKQVKEVKEIKAEVQHIYIKGFHAGKGDVEHVFGQCYSSMIELQHRTMILLTV